MKKVSVILVEDEVLIRKGIKTILEQEELFKVTNEFSNGKDFIDHIELNKPLPDIVLMDINMPTLNGIETTKHLTLKYPELKVIALSSYNSDVFIENMLSIGAVCYMSKNIDPSVMIHNIKMVLKNGFYYDELTLKNIVNKIESTKSFFDADFLSTREREVLNLIYKQKSATEIAEILHISPRTVDGHRNKLLQKTGTKNVVGLVIFAMQNNLLQLNFDSSNNHF